MIRFDCSTCGKLVEVSDEYVGKKGKCPHCQTLMEIPQASAAEAPAAEGVEVVPVETLATASEAAAPPAVEPPGAWYYAVSGQRQGPLSAPALAAQIQAGQLPPTVQVWRSGMDNWPPANTLAEFQQVAAPSAIVPQAARTKGWDEIFCTSCGEIIKKHAMICVKCGVPVSGLTGVSEPKDKTSAVLLAVFLGFWTWCYTYRRDAWKFWLNLGLTVITLGYWGIVAWIWAIIDAARRPREFYVNFQQRVSGQ